MAIEKYNFKVVGSTRPTGHMESKCAIGYSTPEIGNGMGLANVMAYAARGYHMTQIKKVWIYYEDGAQLGPFLAVCNKNGDEIIVKHVSHNGSAWTMTFKRVEA